MKMRKVLISVIIVSIITIILSSIFLLTKHTNTVSDVVSSEIKRASSYNEITDKNYEVNNCEYVRFNAFFTRDLDGDGYAEKYDGTCNYIDKSASLYFDINVLTDGTLQNGKITINGKNFNLSTSLVKDDVIKNDYIGTNTTEILLKDINYGTQKLFSGSIKAKIINNINNYSVENNTVTLTGTWVSTDGKQSIDINKTVTLKTDWYGKTATSVYSNISTSHNIESAIGENDITLAFNVGYRETAEELLLQKQIIEVTIPEFNGYSPIDAISTSQNCSYEYNEETKILTITREAVVDSNGNITNSISRTNTYEVKVTYPIEAYESLGSDVISVTFQTKGYYYGYNNSSDEFSTENPYISSASRNYTHTWRRATGDVARFDVYVGKYTYNQDTSSYRYIISKELPLRIYNNLGEDDEMSDEYLVQWRAYTGNTFESQNGIYMDETQEDRFLNSTGNYISMNDYISTKAIYFSNVDGILADDGYIKVYDRDTNTLLVTFTKDNWNLYTSLNPYYFEQTIKGIKIETSKANENSYFYVHQVKEIDDEKLVTDYPYEEFESLDYIYSYLNGGLFNNTTKSPINTSQNYSFYEAPVSIAKFSVSPNVITNQETKEISMTITPQAKYYNESNWKNGYFVIELPEEILEVVLNSVTSDNSNVKITSYETYEENGKQYIKIYTKNDVETIYSITINANVTADPRGITTNKSIKLNAVNEICPNYRSTSRANDILDINKNSNTEEYVLYKSASLQIVAPTSLLTAQTLSNFDDNGSEVVSPQIAILDKSNDKRDAKINVTITNNYSGGVSEAKIIGKIPFEGNTYQINGRELGSQYSVTMKNTGITVPNEIANIARVYYSSNENVTEDILDNANNWKTAEEVSDWTSIKTYIIDLSNYVLTQKEVLTFTYEIEIPANINYNDVSYSTHAVYFCLNTEDGKLKTSTEVNRLGIMIAKKYDISLTKYKQGKDTLVQGATYKITDGVQARTGITNENGNITISGLYVDKEMLYLKFKHQIVIF